VHAKKGTCHETTNRGCGKSGVELQRQRGDRADHGTGRGDNISSMVERPLSGRTAQQPECPKAAADFGQGKQVCLPPGNTVRFRGLAIADPDKIEHERNWNQDLFQHVQQMGAHVVRIAVHPIAWRERGPKAYLALLDQAVEFSTALGMYVDIDWHSIGNLETELFQDPMYQTSRAETFDFWRTLPATLPGIIPSRFTSFSPRHRLLPIGGDLPHGMNGSGSMKT
jgi:aryl-phospho-beta-D-glucosidase BglC (GH1 family)